MSTEPAKTPSRNFVAYWRRTRRLTMLLLAVWFGVTFGVAWFASALSDLSVFGWTVSYYMAAQGSILIYVLIVGLYAWVMPKFDRMLVDEDGDGK
jgi:putative solute:sodium symporter small subunit